MRTQKDFSTEIISKNSKIIATFNFDKETDYLDKEHYHWDYELQLLTSGDWIFYSNDREFPLKNKDIVFIPRRVRHHFKTSNQNGANKTSIRFSIDIKGQQSSEFENILNSSKIRIFNHQLICDMFLSIGLIKTKESLNALIFAILTLLNENLDSSNQTAKFYSATPFSLLNEIELFLDNNYSNPDLSLEDCASKFAISKRQVDRICKKRHKLGFHQMLTNNRMEAAIDLLKQNKPLNSIYVEVGYNNYVTFYREFKKTYHLSPKQYIELNKN